MEEDAPQLGSVQELEVRHDDLLEQIDELDKRVKQVLKEWRPPAPVDAPVGQ